MVDILALGTALINNLYLTTENKTKQTIDAKVAALNNEGEYKPIQVNNKVLPHTASPRYGNGVLVSDFILVESLSEDAQKQVAQLIELKHSQVDSYDSAVTAVLECCLGILQQTQDVETQRKVFVLLFDEYLWQDTELLKTVSKYVNEDITTWYQSYKNQFQHTEIAVQNVLHKIDSTGNRNIIRQFTDIYYGLNFLDNF